MTKENNLDTLAQLAANLSEADQRTVLQFAEFLAAKSGVDTAPAPSVVPLKKVDIPKPENESVVKALQRLRATYPMINPDTLMKQTTEQMSAHLIKGQSKAETITILEQYFEAQYQAQQ